VMLVPHEAPFHQVKAFANQPIATRLCLV